MSKLPENIFWNLTIANRGDSPISAEFIETRDSDIISSASSYEIAVNRFTIPIQGVPLASWNDATAPSVVLTDVGSGDNYPAKVTYIGTVAAPLVTYSGETGPIYTYHGLLAMINAALKTAFDNLKTAHAGNPMTQQPFMLYDEATGIFSMYLQVLAVADVEVWCSAGLYTYFGNFNAYTASYDPNLLSNKAVKFLFPALGTNVVTLTTSPFGTINNIGGSLIRCSQEYENTGALSINGLRTLVISSVGLPIKAENLSVPGSDGKSVSSSILTDFEPVVSSGASQSRGYIQYQGSGPGGLRWISMTGDNPIKFINIKITVTDNEGHVIPVMLLPNSSMTIKLWFKLKNQYP